MWIIKESRQTDEKFCAVQIITKNVNFRARNGKYCLLTLMFLFLRWLLSPVLVNVLNTVPLKYFDLTEFPYYSEMIMRSDSSLSVFKFDYRT